MVGSTSWGTVLAVLLARGGLPVSLCAFDADDAARLRREGENARLQPGLRFPSNVEVTDEMSEALAGAGLRIRCCSRDWSRSKRLRS